MAFSKGRSRFNGRVQSLVNNADACGMGGNKKAGLVPSNEWNGVTSTYVQRKSVSRLPRFIRNCCGNYK